MHYVLLSRKQLRQRVVLCSLSLRTFYLKSPVTIMIAGLAIITREFDMRGPSCHLLLCLLFSQ